MQNIDWKCEIAQISFELEHCIENLVFEMDKLCHHN
jgi:hypothetical protein